MKNKIPKYHIFWQRWEDPFTQMKNQIEKQVRSNHIEQANSFNDDCDDMGQAGQMIHHNINAMPMMSTPMGLVPMPIPDIASFNFWVGHSNFYITKQIFDLLDKTSGVETLDYFSPYRFRIAIGRAFNENTVKNNIAKTITQHFINNAKKTNHIPT